MSLICLYVLCGSYSGVSFMFVWENIYISFACLQKHYGVRVLHLQHRHCNMCLDLSI
jgi:hypothetical protein